MEQYFSPVHASAESQLRNKPANIIDSPQVAVLRHDNTVEGTYRFADALIRQLRYREAIEVYNILLSSYPANYSLKRLRASCYINTMQPRAAIRDLEFCLSTQTNDSDITFRIGLCHYFLAEYDRAKRYFEQCYSISNDFMGIASIFWHTMAAMREGTSPDLLRSVYQLGMDVGHHKRYDQVMMFFAGYISAEDLDMLMDEADEDIDFASLAYGKYIYLLTKGEARAADDILDMIIKRDGFWIGYPYLAAYNDKYLIAHD